MPKSKYDTLKTQFDEACRTQTVSEFIKTIEAKNKNSHVIHFFLGCAYEEIGDMEKAYQYYQRTIQQANREKNTVQIVQKIYQFTKKTGRKDLNEIIVKRRLPGAIIAQPKKLPAQKPPADLPTQPSVKADVLTPEQAFKQAKQALTNKNVELAMQNLEYAYKGGLRTAKFLYFLAQTFQRLKQYDEAIIYLDMGIMRYPDVDNQILFLNFKAQVLSSQKNHEEAIQAYQQLLKLYMQKDTPQKRNTVFVHIINQHRKLEQIEQAQNILNQFLKEFPQDAQALQLQSALYPPQPTQPTAVVSAEQAFIQAQKAFEDNHLDGVLRNLEDAYNAGFRGAEWMRILADTLQRLKRYDEALKYVEYGVQHYLDIDNRIFFTLHQAQIFAMQKRWEDAVRVYHILLDLYKNNEHAWQRYFVFVELIKLYRKLGQPEQVSSVFYQLQNEFPDEPFTRYLQAKLDASVSFSQIVHDEPQQISLMNGHIDLIELMLLADDKKNEYIARLGEDIADVVFAINETALNHEKPMIFTPTNRDGIIYRYLRTPVKDRQTFIHFALNLYLLVFERTQIMNGKRPQPLGLLPFEFQKQHQFVLEVDVIRHEYGTAHITHADTWQPNTNSISVADVLARYLGSKKSPHDSQFIDLQYGLLTSLRHYLNDLHQHIQNVYAKD
ncbi:MAG: hypothetical protein MUE54_10430 [Anaerolineae bacterium]|nr:hypothetical protein [Anaerolineae bacterium]